MPALCDFHVEVLRRMATHGHADKTATKRAARDIGRQCPQCGGGERRA